MLERQNCPPPALRSPEMASDALKVREFTVGAGQQAPERPGKMLQACMARKCVQVRVLVLGIWCYACV